MNMHLSRAALLLLFTSCAPSREGSDSRLLMFPLAHNTERSQIISETGQVLGLYNFAIEYTDLNRDRDALRTQWRTSTYPVQAGTFGSMWMRDRAILHIIPRGRSTIQQNVYLMVNATLQFEVQGKAAQHTDWVDISATKEYRSQYEQIVKDIRNRMLKYRYEF